MEICLHSFDLPLKHAFTISRATTTVQPTLIVELRCQGHSGFGEATANAYYGVTIDSLRSAIDEVATLVNDYPLVNPTEFYDDVLTKLSHARFAQCALDQAAHDLWGKLQGKPVHELWGLDTSNNCQSNFTIGIDSIDVMIKKLNEMPGWPVYKIKLGTENDIEIIRALRQHTDATFRVDANCGWTADETIANSKQLRELGVEFIEQPLPADRWEEMKLVFAHSALPVIADESCMVESDVPRCEHHFHGINIKLVKCGGLTPARRMIEQARQRGLKVMVGCMTESTVGISAIAQLLPLIDYVDMDGAALLANDIASGAKVCRGVCQYADENGNGVHLISPS